MGLGMRDRRKVPSSLVPRPRTEILRFENVQQSKKPRQMDPKQTADREKIMDCFFAF